jgi:hypothetical protein
MVCNLFLEAVLLKLNRLAKQAACNFNRCPKDKPVIVSYLDFCIFSQTGSGK